MFLFYSSLKILILSAPSEAYSWNKNIPLRRLVAVESVVLWLEVPRARCVDKGHLFELRVLEASILNWFELCLLNTELSSNVLLELWWFRGENFDLKPCIDQVKLLPHGQVVYESVNSDCEPFQVSEKRTRNSKDCMMKNKLIVKMLQFISLTWKRGNQT